MHVNVDHNVKLIEFDANIEIGKLISVLDILVPDKQWEKYKLKPVSDVKSTSDKLKDLLKDHKQPFDNPWQPIGPSSPYEPYPTSPYPYPNPVWYKTDDLRPPLVVTYANI